MAEALVPRRALFAAGAFLPLGASSVVATSAILDLSRQRAAVVVAVDEVLAHSEDVSEAKTDALWEQHDALGARMVGLPIRTLAEARAKLGVVDDLYYTAMHNDGHDRELFSEVLAWIDAALGAA